MEETIFDQTPVGNSVFKVSTFAYVPLERKQKVLDCTYNEPWCSFSFCFYDLFLTNELTSSFLHPEHPQPPLSVLVFSIKPSQLSGKLNTCFYLRQADMRK